ncbi:MAG: DUF4214 domain-containing protein [Saccharofermentans sp.]|nr:DUF4214 domain-containing protein [Saccharofermentans sp.]
MKRCIRFIASVLAASTIALAMPLVPFTGKTVSAANGDLTASIVGNEFFFEYMIQNFNTDGDTSSLSAAECAAVEKFRLPGYGGPTDGSFLRYFPNVTELDLSGNDFKTIDVSTMTNLTSIDVSGNELTGLDLSKNTKLKYVRANSNQYMSSLKLPNSSSLTEVYVYFNSLSSVDLSGCPNLDILEIYQNNLTSLNVSACKNITWIRCFRNNLTSLDISQNSKLSVLECYGNSISTLSVYGVPALVPAIGNFTRITENGYTYDEWSRGGSLCLNVPAGCNVVNTPGGSTPTSNPTPTTAPTPTNISGATITVADQIYTGYPSRPSFTVTLGGKTLVADTDFTFTYSNNSGIGTGTVTITGKGDYTGSKSAYYKIKGDFSTRFVEIAAIPTQTWTGSALQPAVTVTFDEKTLTKGTDYTVSYSNNTNVGTGTVTITGTGNYSGTKTATFKIEKASTPTPTPISGATIAAISAQTYTGNELKPSVTVTLGGKTLVANTDYTVSYSNNTNVGTATVTVTGKGNYGGTKTATFTINKANMSSVTVGSIADQVVYTGNAFTPVPSVTFGSKTLVKDTDFTVTYSNNTNIGTATVTLTGKGNFTGTKTVNFKIVGDLKNCTVSSISAPTYNGSEQTPSITVTYAGKTLTKDTDYTVSYGNNVNAGTNTATVTVTGKGGNYIGTKTVSFTINKCNASNLVIADIVDQTYTGSQISPAVSVTFNGKTLTKGTDYTVAYTNNTNVGTATVTITGSGNFTGTKTANFKIKGNFSKATVDTISDQTYTGSAIEPEVKVTFNGSSLTKGTDYTVAYSNNTAVGTATVKVTGIGLYSGDISKTFKIKGDLKNATISGISKQNWTGSAIKPAFTVTFGGKILTEGTDYTAEYINNTNVGTATITVTGKGDYYTGYIQTTFKIEKNVTVTELTSSNTTISSISSPTYNGSAQQPSFTVTVNGKQLTKNTDYKVEYKNNINAGTATITITGNGNYKGTVTKTFTINAASISGATVNGLSTQTYTGSAFTPTVSVVLGGKTLVLNTDYTVTYSNNTNAGSATVKITGKGNYKDSINKSFTISAKSINGASVAAIANQTYTGKAITPSVTVTLDGKTLVANTDYTATYTNNTNVGTATVTIIGKGNYNNSVKTTFKIVSAATPTPTPAPKTGVEGFCERLYTKALGRASDPNGVKSWVDAIKGGADGARAAYGFFFSPEFTSKNYSNTEYVTRLYRTFMDREPDTAGLNAWVDALNKGATREQVFYGFVNSIEWANICLQYGIESGGTASPTIRVQPNEKIIAFTTRLYTTCLGRNADPSGLKAWAEALANREGTGAQVAYGFFFSEEFVNHNYSNDEYVNRLYLTFLDRPADSVGKKSWVDALNGGASREMVFYGFANSTEFMAMCGDAGIRIK